MPLINLERAILQGLKLSQITENINPCGLYQIFKFGKLSAYTD